MPSLPLLVTDTNIWIDLDNGGLLSEAAQLSYQFCVPGLAIIDELLQPGWPAIESLGVTALELEVEEIQALPALRLKYRSLSLIDLAAYLLAKRQRAMLLTGDSHLRKLGLESGLTVHGILWLLDELLACQTIDYLRAANALQSILDGGARLPEDETMRRFNRWTKIR